MSDLLQVLITVSGRSDVAIVQDPLRLRPSDLQVLIGNCDKFKALTGWQPEIKLEQTLKDIYEYFKENQ